MKSNKSDQQPSFLSELETRFRMIESILFHRMSRLLELTFLKNSQWFSLKNVRFQDPQVGASLVHSRIHGPFLDLATPSVAA